MLLSVCILLKDDGECLRRVAAMVKGLADEVVVVCDDPVSESIKLAAEESGARVVPHQWRNDFAAGPAQCRFGSRARRLGFLD